MQRLIEIPPDEVYGIRDRAMMELLYSSGLKLSELVRLDRTDLDLDTSSAIPVTSIFLLFHGAHVIKCMVARAQEVAQADSAARDELTRLYLLHRRPMVMFLCAKGRQCIQDAEEIVQESFVRVWTVLQNGRRGLKAAYLYETCYHLLIDRCRKRDVWDRHVPRILAELEGWKDEVENRVLVAQQIQDLRRYVAEMPRGHQQAFEMYFIEGHLQREIAKNIKVTLRTVTNYISDATVYCRLRLDGADVAAAWREIKQ